MISKVERKINIKKVKWKKLSNDEITKYSLDSVYPR